jgi:hypothetical protein
LHVVEQSVVANAIEDDADVVAQLGAWRAFDCRGHMAASVAMAAFISRMRRNALPEASKSAPPS